MKAHFLALVLPLPVLAGTAEPKLSNEYLEVVTSGETGTLLCFLGKKDSGVNQLRKAQEETGFLAGLSGGGDGQEGLQIAVVQKDGSGAPLIWQPKQQDNGTIKFTDTSGRFEARLSLFPSTSAVDLVIVPLPDAPSYQSLQFTWTLQVGGDFLAVTTEGVADRDIIPTNRSEGAPFLHIADIEREEDVSFSLSQPWFAVADKNQAVTFAVWFDLASGGTLECWSGQLLGSESMSRTLRVPSLSNPLHLRMMLLEPIQEVTAIMKEGAIHWNAQGTLQFLSAERIEEGWLRLIAAQGDQSEDPILEARVNQWLPGEPKVFRVAKPPAIDRKLRIKLKDSQMDLLQQQP